MKASFGKDSLRKGAFRQAAYGFALAGVLFLAACNSGNGGGGADASAATSPSPSAPASASAGGTDNGAGASASPSAGSGSSAGESPSVPPKIDAAIADQINELLTLAKKGQAPGIPFAAHDSLIDDVEKAWGKADKSDSAGKGIYAVYGKHDAVFGFNKGSQIFDVRSSDAKLRKLTLLEIEQTLGKPSSTTRNGDDTIYVYQASEDFQLKFVIPKSTGTVDHISVFAEKDSVNNMAG
ncbi:YjgB family protein [Cohnella sp. 56]|uniref:YjgB family protein n=1 Tax=Cohnella sp. 56 TaxID=3113722 RepID=UPI0030EA2544